MNKFLTLIKSRHQIEGTRPLSNENEDDLKAEKKLKELERNLAKELDQQVRLTEASDSRLDGSVMLNPNLDVSTTKAKKGGADLAGLAKLVEPAHKDGHGVAKISDDTVVKTGTPPPGVVPPGEKHFEELSLSEIDGLLNQLDEGFQKSLEGLKTDLSDLKLPEKGFESMSIGADYLQGFETKSDGESKAILAGVRELQKVVKPRLFPSLFLLMKNFTNIFSHMGNSLLISIKSYRKKPNKEIMAHFVSELKETKNLIPPVIQSGKTFVTVIFGYDRVTYTKFLISLILISLLYYLVLDIREHLKPDSERDPFLRSFNDVANLIQVMPEEEGQSEDDLDVESAIRHPEFTYLIHRIVANLKPPSSRRTPMAAIELFLEATSRECAVEIHDRENEVRDAIERTIEETTFDEIDSPHGKIHLKNKIRTSLNRLLNRGNIKTVFFKNITFHR